jgi:hypothetical protein
MSARGLTTDGSRNRHSLGLNRSTVLVANAEIRVNLDDDVSYSKQIKAIPRQGR